MPRFYEAVRLVTTLAGTVSFAGVFFVLRALRRTPALAPPRSVIALEFFLTFSFLGAPRLLAAVGPHRVLRTRRFQAP